MKTYVGSLQKKGRRYYLVVHKEGTQRWFALKTDNLCEARIRAARIAPPDPSDLTAWLEQLVREGAVAQHELAVHRIKHQLTWANIASVCTMADVAESSADSRRTHERWFERLQEMTGIVSPGALSREQAIAAMKTMGEQYVSAPRMLRFFRRAWHVIGLDATIWPRQVPSSEKMPLKRMEHYRRLTLDEIRRVYRYLTERVSSLADMVLLGYATGLRLSDVVELELSEVDGDFLKVCPNKTRRCKPRPLRIPLTREAQATIARLSALANAERRLFLFGERARRDTSRHIARAFRACGILRQGDGRASFHSLRATFISLMDEAGVPPHITDAITGHGGGGMHARYTQPSDAALTEAVSRALPDLL